MTMRLSTTLQGHTKSVVAAWFSPSGHNILSLSADGSYRLWDTDSGQELFLWSRKNILDAIFHPIHQELWLAGSDGSVSKFSLTYLEQREILRISNSALRSLALASSGKFLLCSTAWAQGQPGKLEMYHLNPVSLYQSIAGYFDELAVSPCETRALAASNCLELWGLEPKLERLSHMDVSQDFVSGAWFSPKGNYAVGMSSSGIYEIFSIKDSALSHLHLPGIGESWNGHDIHGSPRLAFTPDENYVIQTSHDEIIIFELLTRREKTLLTHASGSLHCVALSPNGQRLASGGQGGINLWELDQFSLVEKFGSEKYPVYGLQFHPRENKLISFGGCELQIWQFD